MTSGEASNGVGAPGIDVLVGSINIMAPLPAWMRPCAEMMQSMSTVRKGSTGGCLLVVLAVGAEVFDSVVVAIWLSVKEFVVARTARQSMDRKCRDLCVCGGQCFRKGRRSRDMHVCWFEQ